MSVEKITRIALLSALCVVLRFSFGIFPNVKPITAIFLVSILSLGFVDGFLVMVITMLITSFLFGFGIWVFFQIVSYLIIFCFWWIFFKLLTRRLLFGIINEVIFQAILAGVLALIYGLIIDSITAYVYHMPWWAYLLNGLSFDLAHGISTALFYPVIHFIFRRLLNEKIT